MICDTDQLRSIVDDLTPLAIEVRRHIHRHPELGHQELETTRYIAKVLSDAGLDPVIRPAGTGLTVEVGSGQPVVGFRADIDALPIEEKTHLPFASEVPGLMHACGHDAHTAIGIGMAIALSKLDDLDGTIRFIFQPAEEVFPGGAGEMVREGLVDGVDSMLAFHVDPTLPPGQIGFRAGPVTASSDQFKITVRSPGGHTARPHQTADSIYAAGRIITELPMLLDRLTDARVPLVVVFGKVAGGFANNVIPTEVELRGTARTLGKELWEQMPKLFDRLTREIVAPTGADVLVDYVTGIAPVVNDEHIVNEARLSVGQVLGPHAVVATHQSMGAEDFSAYLHKVPGALFRLGSRPSHTEPSDLHSSTFDIDEEVIPTGILAGTAIMLGRLSCTF